MNGASLNTTSFWKLLPICAPKEPPPVLFHERTDSGWKESLVYRHSFWSQHPMPQALRPLQLQQFILRAGFKVSFIHTWKSVFLLSSAMYLSFFSFFFFSPKLSYLFMFCFWLMRFQLPNQESNPAPGQSPNHWTIRECPQLFFLRRFYLVFLYFLCWLNPSYQNQKSQKISTSLFVTPNLLCWVATLGYNTVYFLSKF